MLLTSEMFAAGMIAAVCQAVAHLLMKRRTYITPIPRYAVGVTLALVPWSAALAANRLQEPIVGVWFVFGASGFATWLAYELDKKQPTEADAERLASYLAAEHTDEP